MEHGSSASAVGGDKLELFKNQAKQLLKKLTPRSAAKLSIDSNPYIFQYVVSRVLRNWFSIETFRTLLRISSFYFSMYSYMIDNGICYLTLTDKSYPKRLAFLFLEEISKDFEADLRAEHGDEYVLFKFRLLLSLLILICTLLNLFRLLSFIQWFSFLNSRYWNLTKVHHMHLLSTHVRLFLIRKVN